MWNYLFCYKINGAQKFDDYKTNNIDERRYIFV